MRKVSLVLGFIILFIGIIVSSASNISRDNPREIQVGEQHGWGISGLFDEGDELFVRFPPPKHEGVPDTYQIVRVDIFDPNKTKTRFELTFKKGVLDDINVSSLDGGLIVSEPPTGIGGITQYSGNYTAYIDPEANPLANFYYPNGPPTIELLKLVVEKEYPYSGFLPVGIALIAIGLSLTIWSMKSSKGKRRRKKRKI